VATRHPVVFPGSDPEREALLAAVAAVCTCARDQDGRLRVCGAHTLLFDERALKHLLFYRRLRFALWPDETATN
jgi:hypothetical protein